MLGRLRRAQWGRADASIWKRLLTAVGALGLVLTALVTFPAAANAAPNEDIAITNPLLEGPDDGQLTVGDSVTFTGDWDAVLASPEPGQTFFIELPEELGFTANLPIDLTGKNPAGEDVVWATCQTDVATRTVTCTLTEQVALYPEEVQGTFEFELTVEQATTAEEVVFNFNGTETPVDLPGEGGIDDGVVVPEDWDKTGVLNSNKWSMGWTINLPGASLVGHGTVNVFEDLSDNHQLCDPSNLKVETVRGDTVVEVTEIAAISTEVSAPYDFSFVLTEPAGGWDPNVTYRITYDTCTPDGEIDPKGTEYTNEAVVDIFGNDSSGIIGVTQDWSITADVAKSGSVLGGADRNGKVSWTVAVAGDHLTGKTSFEFDETLTGEHEVCADTISGLRVVERYGPSSQRDVNVTGELNIQTVASSTGGFKLNISIADGSDFTFKPNDYRYLLIYTTCVTTDGLPEEGTAFTNSASVDGKTATTSPEVPERTDRKRGSINGSAVTLDGVEYLPQTTINWNITVPGENVADVAGPLTVTDVISGAHQVCGVGDGDVTDRIGLRVQARDQIQGGGLSTVTLEGATATLSGETITINIPQPELVQPDGSTQTGFSREYQYVITYTTCTTSGGMDAPGTTYGNDAEVAGQSYSHSTTQNNRGSGTGTGVARGSVAISKSLADTVGAGLIPDGTMFTVHVQEVDPTGTVQAEYDLQVPVNGDAVNGLNPRGHGWTAVISEPTFPSIPGVVFGAPRFAAGEGVTPSEDGTTAVAALTPGSNIAVTVTNTAQLGSIEVTKVLEGPASALVDPNLEYSMTASIDVSGVADIFPLQPDREFTVKAGETYTLTDLPIGAVVTISETRPADDDLFTWGDPVIAPETIEVVAGHVTEPGTVTVTNSVERSVNTFYIAKNVTGEQAENPAVPAEVTVTATWVEDGETKSKVLTIPTDGTPIAFGENLLIGTEVTLTETPLEDGSSIAWAAPVWSGEGVSIEGDSAVVKITRGAQALVSIDNHAATSTAGLSIIKGVAGEAAGEVPEGTEFPVTVTWTDAEGVEQSRDLTINANEPTELGEDLPAGTVVTITEGERPAFDTVVWGSIVISGDDVTDAGDGSATVVVSDQQGDMTLVSVLNEATWAPGTFALAKDVTGVLLDDPDVPESVTVIATWIDEAGEAQSAELTLPTDGTRVEFGADLPHGTEVLLTEVAPADSARFTWDAPIWGGEALEVREDGSAIVTIGAATVAEVSITNNATASLGSLELTKALTGSGASSVPAGTVFPVTLTWTDLLGETQQREVEVPAGETVVIGDLPLGTEVSVVESDVSLAGDLRWESVTWLTDDASVALAEGDDDGIVIVVTGEAGHTAALTFENEIIKEEGGLVSTGADGVMLGAAALGGLGLVGAGAFLLIRRRRAA